MENISWLKSFFFMHPIESIAERFVWVASSTAQTAEFTLQFIFCKQAQPKWEKYANITVLLFLKKYPSNTFIARLQLGQIL